MPDTSKKWSKGEKFRMFLERMRRAGREKEWYVRVKQVMADQNIRYGAAQPIAMKQMGFENWEAEVKLHEEYLLSLRSTTRVMQEEIREEKKQENFEEVLAGLPNNADPKTEIDWISAHPAMLRKNRQKDATKQILITADDLLTTAAGPAPSKAAIAKLQHWANAPHEFFKNYTGDKKSIEVEKKEGGGSTDASVEEINALLDSLDS